VAGLHPVPILFLETTELSQLITSKLHQLSYRGMERAALASGRRSCRAFAPPAEAKVRCKLTPVPPVLKLPGLSCSNLSTRRLRSSSALNFNFNITDIAWHVIDTHFQS
jgi:hypothetical protein